MDRKLYRECIEKEVYDAYKKSKKRLTLFDKIWCRYISPSSNAVFLIRKKQYLESKGSVCKMLSKYYRVKLIRRYGIHVNSEANIGIGLRIVHPMCISISKCEIGNNFTIYQSCTIGAKSLSCFDTATIGNDCTMYSGSSIIGNVKVCDHVSLGANSLLLKDANEKGTYVGSPAKLISNERKNI